MEIINIFGSLGTARPLHAVVQLSIIGLIIAGAAFFIYFSFIPFIAEFETPILSKGIIISSEGGICEVMTDDDLASTKLITSCYLKEGDEVSISYQKGIQYATIVNEQ